MSEYSKRFQITKSLLVWSLYYTNQQKPDISLLVFTKITKLVESVIDTLQCTKQHKFVDCLLIWS